MYRKFINTLQWEEIVIEIKGEKHLVSDSTE